MWLCPPLGWARGELPSRHQELTSLGAAPVGLVPLKPCDLGLSHSLGIYSWTVSEISKAELSTWRERRRAEGCSVCLVGFFLQCEGKLWETLKINIYGKPFVFEY